jgi:hypothetical protein
MIWFLDFSNLSQHIKWKQRYISYHKRKWTVARKMTQWIKGNLTTRKLRHFYIIILFSFLYFFDSSLFLKPSFFFSDNKNHNETPVASTGISCPHSCAWWLRRQSGEPISSIETYTRHCFPWKQNYVSPLRPYIAIWNNFDICCFAFYLAVGIRRAKGMCMIFNKNKQLTVILRLNRIPCRILLAIASHGFIAIWYRSSCLSVSIIIVWNGAPVNMSVYVEFFSWYGTMVTFT